MQDKAYFNDCICFNRCMHLVFRSYSWTDLKPKAIKNFPADQIDKIIDTMPGRMHQIIANGGDRLRY